MEKYYNNTENKPANNPTISWYKKKHPTQPMVCVHIPPNTLHLNQRRKEKWIR